MVLALLFWALALWLLGGCEAAWGCPCCTVFIAQRYSTHFFTRVQGCAHTCKCAQTYPPTQSHLKTQIIILVKEMALKLQSKASTLVVVLETKHPEKRVFIFSDTFHRNYVMPNTTRTPERDVSDHSSQSGRIKNHEFLV